MLLVFCGALLLAASVLAIKQIITNRLALLRFKKLSNGLPLCPEARLFGNHISTVMMGENNCEKLQLWHKQLGKTIGWLKGSQFCVSTVDLDLIKMFIHDESDIHIDRLNTGMPFEEVAKSILQATKDEWRKFRRTIGPALASTKFKDHNVHEDVERSISKLIDLIDKQIAANKRDPDYKFVMDDIMNKFAVDLIFRSFYRQEGLVDFDNPNDPWTRDLELTFEEPQTSLVVRISIIFPTLVGLIDSLIMNFTTHGVRRRKIIGFVRSQANLNLKARKQLEQMKADAKLTGAKFDENNFIMDDGTRFRRSIIDHVIDKYIEGKLTKDQYTNNAVVMLTAGEKTLMDSLVHTIYLLSINQQVQTQLRESIMAEGKDSELLDWVIKESLRLLPPAPIGCSRNIERDIEIDGGYVLPAGTSVVTCAYVIHRLKEYWGDDAEEFRPERWRDTSHHHPFQYLAFGAGSRSCPGRMFAMHTMKMLLTALLVRYKFDCSPRKDAYKFHSPFWMWVLPKSLTIVSIKRINEHQMTSEPNKVVDTN